MYDTNSRDIPRYGGSRGFAPGEDLEGAPEDVVDDFVNAFGPESDQRSGLATRLAFCIAPCNIFY